MKVIKDFVTTDVTTAFLVQCLYVCPWTLDALQLLICCPVSHWSMSLWMRLILWRPLLTCLILRSGIVEYLWCLLSEWPSHTVPLYLLLSCECNWFLSKVVLNINILKNPAHRQPLHASMTCAIFLVWGMNKYTLLYNHLTS
jgi:hypothetical protein